MNFIFPFIFSLSCVCLLFLSPDSFLSALLDGASSAATLSVALLASYAVWLGLANVWERSGLTRAFSKILTRPVKKLFRIKQPDTVEAVCMNLSANLLGLGSVATPYGVRSACLMEEENAPPLSPSLLFVVNATSLQLIPTSVIAIRTALSANNPTDVVLPSVVCMLFSLVLSVSLTYLFFAKKKSAPLPPCRPCEARLPCEEKNAQNRRVAERG